jgi:hypothetical protein
MFMVVPGKAMRVEASDLLCSYDEGRAIPDWRKTPLIKGRPVVLFSKYDVVAAGAGIVNYRALAYKPEKVIVTSVPDTFSALFRLQPASAATSWLACRVR